MATQVLTLFGEEEVPASPKPAAAKKKRAPAREQTEVPDETTAIGETAAIVVETIPEAAPVVVEIAPDVTSVSPEPPVENIANHQESEESPQATAHIQEESTGIPEAVEQETAEEIAIQITDSSPEPPIENVTHQETEKVLPATAYIQQQPAGATEAAEQETAEIAIQTTSSPGHPIENIENDLETGLPETAHIQEQTVKLDVPEPPAHIHTSGEAAIQEMSTPDTADQKSIPEEKTPSPKKAVKKKTAAPPKDTGKKKSIPKPSLNPEESPAVLSDWQAEKQYYTIGETAALFGVNISHIRFWTNEFGLKVRTTRKGDRLYPPEIIQELRMIYHLVKERGFTLNGAKTKLKENKKGELESVNLRQSLLSLRSHLVEIRNQIT